MESQHERNLFYQLLHLFSRIIVSYSHMFLDVTYCKHQSVRFVKGEALPESHWGHEYFLSLRSQKAYIDGLDVLTFFSNEEAGSVIQRPFSNFSFDRSFLNLFEIFGILAVVIQRELKGMVINPIDALSDALELMQLLVRQQLLWQLHR